MSAKVSVELQRIVEVFMGVSVPYIMRYDLIIVKKEKKMSESMQITTLLPFIIAFIISIEFV